MPTKRTLSSGSRVPPAVIEHAAAGERARREQLLDPRGDLDRLGQAADAPLALRHLAFVRPDELDAALAQRRDVRPRRRMRPHARVHGGRDEHRPAMGERRLGEHVVGDPVRELRERVRGAGATTSRSARVRCA